MKIFSLILLLLLSLSANASDCLYPPKSWKQTETTIEIEINKLEERVSQIKVLLMSPSDTNHLKEIEDFESSKIKVLQSLKQVYQQGDKLFELKAPPLSGPILLCLKRNTKLIKEVVITYQ